MTDINNVTLLGRVTQEIGERDFQYLNTGTCKLTIHIANNESRKQGDNWIDEASFFDVVVWGKAAENLKQKIFKGVQVVVSGRLKQDRWKDQNGNNKSRIYINSESVRVFEKGGNYQNDNYNQYDNNGGGEWQ
jgi:single-strand DNA-binding protein